jgi:hypothetical protein
MRSGSTRRGSEDSSGRLRISYGRAIPTAETIWGHYVHTHRKHESCAQPSGSKPRRVRAPVHSRTPAARSA